METKKPENPFAFPLALSGEHSYASDGMTLRDYFATKAMQSLLTNSQKYNLKPYSEIPDMIARDSYIIADVMLKHR